MSHIDRRSLPADAVVVFATSVKGTGLALLVDEDVAAQLGAFVDGVPLITDPNVEPVFPDAVVDLGELRAARVAELLAELRAYVDGVVSRDEREMLISDLLKVARGMPVAPERVGLAAAVERFTDRAQAEGDRLTAACEQCSTVEELYAVVVDISAVGVPS